MMEGARVHVQGQMQKPVYRRNVRTCPTFEFTKLLKMGPTHFCTYMYMSTHLFMDNIKSSIFLLSCFTPVFEFIKINGGPTDNQVKISGCSYKYLVVRTWNKVLVLIS